MTDKEELERLREICVKAIHLIAWSKKMAEDSEKKLREAEEKLREMENIVQFISENTLDASMREAMKCILKREMPGLAFTGREGG